MKYTTITEINKPIDEVIALFDKEENLYGWMEGLQSFEALSGTPGKKGARSKLRFKTGNREIEMIETILKNDLPNEFTVSFDMGKGSSNTVSQRFESISSDKTKNIVESEFHFAGIMKYLAPLFKGMFKKQSMKYQIAFKNFVESK